MPNNLVDIQGLTLAFPSPGGPVRVLRGVDLHIEKGEILGLVGESGSGKSLTSLAVMGLVPRPHSGLEGHIFYRGRDILNVPEKEIRTLRGKNISMIFQEPMTSLNPVYTVGDQIAEAIRTHERLSRPEALERAVDLLRKVGVPAPEKRIKSYPHQLSGGMRQRVMIAMALSCSPDLLIADEPTTALDVTIQAQILDLILHLQKATGMAVLLITHALGVVAETADRVAVMYAGNIVESASTKALFSSPGHPYTLGLLQSIPRIDRQVESLCAIPGMVPSPKDLGEGCKFASRCAFAADFCFEEEPALTEIAPKHFSRCWKPDFVKTESREEV
ncbi:MAG: ABC transporter ATP-binding protein [Synergistaceae bacterium]|jgi:peptide/nickel transport system ATP-binding protein/oligopeptide transport system ATP-binding protein|nr:ABC transporter ATP-binding protein [Synergistaceae bacterium]